MCKCRQISQRAQDERHMPAEVSEQHAVVLCSMLS